jgi:hypothetical protein
MAFDWRAPYRDRMSCTITRIPNGALPDAAPSIFVSCTARTFTQTDERVTFPFSLKFERSKERALARAIQWAESRGITTIYVEDAPAA